jgi:hypothetical protein
MDLAQMPTSDEGSGLNSNFYRIVLGLIIGKKKAVFPRKHG